MADNSPARHALPDTIRALEDLSNCSDGYVSATDLDNIIRKMKALLTLEDLSADALDDLRGTEVHVAGRDDGPYVLHAIIDGVATTLRLPDASLCSHPLNEVRTFDGAPRYWHPNFHPTGTPTTDPTPFQEGDTITLLDHAHQLPIGTILMDHSGNKYRRDTDRWRLLSHGPDQDTGGPVNDWAIPAKIHEIPH